MTSRRETKKRRKTKGGVASSDSVELYQPRSRGRGQRRLDLKRDEIFLESLDRFLGQSVPIDPAFIAPFIRGRVHFPILASRINDPRRSSSSSRKVFGNRYDCRDDVRFSYNGRGHALPSTSQTPKEFHQTRFQKRGSLREEGVTVSVSRPKLLHVSADRFLPIKLHAPPSRSPTPYFEMYLRRTCSGIVNNLSSRASPCFDPFKCLLTRSVELQ